MAIQEKKNFSKKDTKNWSEQSNTKETDGKKSQKWSNLEGNKWETGKNYGEHKTATNPGY